MKQWRGKCQRCYKKTDCHIMSMYNEELICMDCKQKEQKRDDYEQARQRDIEEYRRRYGNQLVGGTYSN